MSSMQEKRRDKPTNAIFLYVLYHTFHSCWSELATILAMRIFPRTQVTVVRAHAIRLHEACALNSLNVI